MAELGAVLGGRYRLDLVLGQGGMATIFRATDAKLGREVAVKVLRPEFGVDPEFVERFSHEARAAASLNHPNVVAVYDFGTDPAGPFIVMEQVAGGDLSVALGERGVLPPTAVARTGQQVADALAAAHARGLVHRDIKPGNILLSPDGRVQVADFGIAQAAADSPVTTSGLTLGSVLYFSPEQARGDSATAASDVYSLGLVMYELLTGRRAFSGDSPAAVAVARLSGGVPSPMSVRPDTPPALDAIVRWCLAADPAARPTAAELSVALARFIADPSGAAYATSAGAAGAAGAAGPAGVGDGVSGSGVLGPVRQPMPADADHWVSGPWGWLAAGFGLIVIVASGILLFLLFSGIGEASPSPSPEPTATMQVVGTPDFVGRSEAAALRLADRHGLELEIEYVESDGRPGRVLDQLPDQGVEIPVGTIVAVMVATRAETVIVPDVYGMSEADAAAQLEAAGLQPGQRRRADDRLPEGYVISTDPRAGVSMTRDSIVDYVVSTGQGSWSAAASPATASPGSASPRSASPAALSIATAGPSASPSVAPRAQGSMAPASTVPASTTPESAPPGSHVPATSTPVVSPSASHGGPAASASVAPTDVVPTSPSTPTAGPTQTPAVSQPPDASPHPISSPSPTGSAAPSPFPSTLLVLVGDFRCLDLATARAHIEEAGLLIGATIPADPPPGDGWLVQEQLPDAGAYLPPGSNVDLVLADPMEPCPGG